MKRIVLAASLLLAGCSNMTPQDRDEAARAWESAGDEMQRQGDKLMLDSQLIMLNARILAGP